jgi:hypothetical protein
MSSERPEEFSQPPASRGRQSSDDRRDSDAGNHGPSDDATRRIATVVVRGEESPPKDSPHKGTEASADRRGRVGSLAHRRSHQLHDPRARNHGRGAR